MILVLGALAVARRRWAYIAFVALCLLGIPSRTGFRLVTPRCDLTPSRAQIVESLGNRPHVVIFFVFFLITVRQFRGAWYTRYGKAAIIGMAVGIVLELEQGATRTGNCDLHDLIPDAMGIVLGALAMVMWDAAVRAVRGDRTLDSRSTGG